ncbi:MAG TPA: hypothetical protein VGM44_23010 [Polyangiaceae bacterium]
MTPRELARVLLGYVLGLALIAIVLSAVLGLNRKHAPTGTKIVSVWQGGVRVARAVVSGDATHTLEAEAGRGGTRVVSEIVDSAPMLSFNRLIFAACVAPVKDGVMASYAGQTAYATPDDLLKAEAYEANLQLGPTALVLGIDADKVLGLLAKELRTTPDELFQHGKFRRFALKTEKRPFPREVTPSNVKLDDVRYAVLSSARYLARNQKRDGSFRYEVDATTGADSNDYNFPRHAGATYFLARAGNQLRDAHLFHAGRQAGAYMKDRTTLHCGAHACVGQGDEVDVGASALGLLAYVELLNGGAGEFRDAALDIAAFLRSQQLANGDFMHFYSVKEQHPINVQVEYYTGEAAFALARVARISGDARDLEAAKRALSFLVGRSPLFIGAHYFWGAEHWTCQVMEDLWQRAPDETALRFCLDWQAANRNLQLSSPPEPPEYDGGLSRGPFVSPRLTPLASRLEAAVATLSVARGAGVDQKELALLEDEIRRGFAFLLRYQFSPGPTYLMPDPRGVSGGVPGSPVDLHVRIDYPQHAGDAWLRWLELNDVRH